VCWCCALCAISIPGVDDYLKENFAKGVRRFTILAPTDSAYKLYKPNAACRIPARTQTSQLFLPQMYTAVGIRRLRNGMHVRTPYPSRK